MFAFPLPTPNGTPSPKGAPLPEGGAAPDSAEAWLQAFLESGVPPEEVTLELEAPLEDPLLTPSNGTEDALLEEGDAEPKVLPPALETEAPEGLAEVIALAAPPEQPARLNPLAKGDAPQTLVKSDAPQTTVVRPADAQAPSNPSPAEPAFLQDTPLHAAPAAAADDLPDQPGPALRPEPRTGVSQAPAEPIRTKGKLPTATLQAAPTTSGSPPIAEDVSSPLPSPGPETPATTTPEMKPLDASPPPAPIIWAGFGSSSDPEASNLPKDSLAPLTESHPQEHRATLSRADAPRGPMAPTPQVVLRQVADQLNLSLRETSRGITEVKLSPEELGRVRMRMHPSETGMHIVLTAERADVNDLLRRNIDGLEQELRDLGYADVSFDFEQAEHSEQSSENNENEPEQRSFDQPEIPVALAPRPAPSLASGTLDLKL